jgi:hypothetical protein
MLLQLFAIAFSFVIATQQLYTRSRTSIENAGLLKKTDLLMARSIIKRYRKDMHEVYLSVRTTIWNWQWALLIAGLIIGYPSSLIDSSRHRIKEGSEILNQASEGKVDEAKLERFDNIVFWIFCTGLFKDSRVSQEMNFYAPLLIVAAGLVFEKQCINWLTDRNGCNYYRLQKFVELETRLE